MHRSNRETRARFHANGPTKRLRAMFCYHQQPSVAMCHSLGATWASFGTNRLEFHLTFNTFKEQDSG